MILFACVLSVLCLTTQQVGALKVDKKSLNFIDEYGRTRVYHGMNAVYKIAPWHPDVTGFDSDNSECSTVCN